MKTPNTKEKIKNKTIQQEYQQFNSIYVYEHIEENLAYLQQVFSKCADFSHKIICSEGSDRRILLAFIESITNKGLIDDHILRPLLTADNKDIFDKNLTITIANEKLITACKVSEFSTYDNLLASIVSGEILLFIDGFTSALSVGNEEIKGRSYEKPEAEQTVRGPRESFVENLQPNLVLIRKRIRNPALAVEILTVGRKTATNVALIYLKNVIRQDIPESIKANINKIDFDGILESAQLEQLIEKHKWTPFPQMLATERPDKVVGSILEGRAALLVEGTPFAIIVPTTLSLFLNSPDDYYGRTVISSLIRLIRYIGLFASTSISPLYVALTSYHPGLLPTSLALSVTGGRIGLPFPIVIEVLLMEVILFLIQEAAIRLPKPVGQTVGIVGGLVIGQSVVQAGILSPVIVVIVAMSAIASFTLPNYTFALGTIILRLFLLSLASIFGLYGIAIGWILILIHASTLENYGVKYLEDYAPYSITNFKDSLIKAPQSMIQKRPHFLDVQDLVRQDPKVKDENKNES